MRKWSARAALGVIAIMVVTTFIGVVAVDAWWIRVFDFPRLLFAMIIIATLAVLAILNARWAWAWGGLGLLALGFQLYQLYPYTALPGHQAVAASTCANGHGLQLLSLNVLQDNRDYQRTIDLVQKEQPDIFLAMETDASWIDALAVLEADYPHGAKVPLDNYYGMALYSRLPLSGLAQLELAGDETPLITARVHLPSGLYANFFAVHPLPPRPGQDSDQRDAELVLLADLVRESGRPTLVMGDFNDVPWSRVIETFQRVGGLVDPRIGRGYFASFDATNPLLRWPLDHAFFTDDFAVMQFDRRSDVGSDHFPLALRLCLQPERFEHMQEAPPLTKDARENAAEELEDAEDSVKRVPSQQLQID